MSHKVIKLEKEDFTKENIQKAYKAVCLRQIREAVQEQVAYGIYKAQWYAAHPEAKREEEQ